MNEANKIAERLNNNGRNWATDELISFDALVNGATKEYRDGHGTDTVRYDFSDGSSILVAGSAWDIGFSGCFCWEGEPDQDCENPQHNASRRVAQISVDNGNSHQTAEELIERSSNPDNRNWLDDKWWPVLVQMMDDETRESIDTDTREEFILEYVKSAPCDLVVG